MLINCTVTVQLIRLLFSHMPKGKFSHEVAHIRVARGLRFKFHNYVGTMYMLFVVAIMSLHVGVVFIKEP